MNTKVLAYTDEDFLLNIALMNVAIFLFPSTEFLLGFRCVAHFCGNKKIGEFILFGFKAPLEVWGFSCAAIRSSPGYRGAFVFSNQFL